MNALALGKDAAVSAPYPYRGLGRTCMWLEIICVWVAELLQASSTSSVLVAVDCIAAQRCTIRMMGGVVLMQRQAGAVGADNDCLGRTRRAAFDTVSAFVPPRAAPLAWHLASVWPITAVHRPRQLPRPSSNALVPSTHLVLSSANCPPRTASRMLSSNLEYQRI